MKRNISNGMVILLAFLVIAGGIFFGLFSCGGYVWHKQLHTSLMAIASIFIMVAPPNFLRNIWRRAAFITTSLVLFIVVRAFASAFHPAPPENISEFMKSFVIGVQYGPC